MSVVTLELSGTSLTGYRHDVNRHWALSMPPDLLADEMKNIILNFCNSNNLWKIIEEIKQTNLHIHAKYDENSDTIYVCTCS